MRRFFILVILVGCTAQKAPQGSTFDEGMPSSPPNSPVVTAPAPVGTTQLLAWQQQAMWRGWNQLLQMPMAQAPVVEWRDDTCADGTPHMVAFEGGFCAPGAAVAGRIYVAVAADGSFPKQVFMHELIHIYIWAYNLPDNPTHSTGVWALEWLGAKEMTDDGIPGVDGTNPWPPPPPPSPPDANSQRSMTVQCGRELQACCDDGTPCNPGFTCGFLSQIGWRCYQ